MAPSESFRVGQDASDIVRALQRAKGRKGDAWWGGVIFLIGAGCSKSAGIPLGEEIAREAALDLARRYSNGDFSSDSSDEALRWLCQHHHLAPGTKWAQAYGQIFEAHYTDPAQQRSIILSATTRGRGINWAHICLGELIRERYVHTVMTTNFDQLVLSGITRSGLLPVVADGIESLSRVDGRPAIPQVIHLHGSQHTYSPRNSTTAVMETARSSAVVRALAELLRNSPALIVVGYAGGEEGVMRVLIDAADDLGRKTVYWVQYGANPEDLSPRASELLTMTSGSLVVGKDADVFFAELMRGVGHGIPGWMKDPIQGLDERALEVVTPQNATIYAEIESYQTRLAGLRQCRDRQEAARGEREKRLAEFRELALSGKSTEALQAVSTIIDTIEDPREIEALADVASDAGKKLQSPQLLQVAIREYRRALERLSRTEAPTVRARVHRALGHALSELGSREQESAHLDEAVREYQKSLRVYTRDALPIEWAETQRSMARALVLLGSRDTGPDRLLEAADSFRAALAIQTRDKFPIEWAASLNGLGAALGQLHTRGTKQREHLVEAEQALRQALEVRTRERLPNEWASSKLNLATVLSELGGSTDAVKLREAVQTQRAVLEVWTRDAYPIDWAKTQSNLSITLRRLGILEKDPETLKASIDAIQLVLKVQAREDVPFIWATSQNNLGFALEGLGDLESGVERYEEAIAAYKRALEIYTEKDTPSAFARVQACLRRVEEKVAHRREAPGQQP